MSVYFTIDRMEYGLNSGRHRIRPSGQLEYWHFKSPSAGYWVAYDDDVDDDTISGVRGSEGYRVAMRKHKLKKYKENA